MVKGRAAGVLANNWRPSFSRMSAPTSATAYKLIESSQGQNSASSFLTLAEVDLALDQLASYSSFSQLENSPVDPPSQHELLTRLFKLSHPSPSASGLLVQIILHDIRPYLDPLPSLNVRNPTSMLRLRSTAGPPQLDLHSAMECWDPNMAELYMGGTGNIDWCVNVAEKLSNEVAEHGAGLPDGPVVGVNVQVCL